MEHFPDSEHIAGYQRRSLGPVACTCQQNLTPWKGVSAETWVSKGSSCSNIPEHKEFCQFHTGWFPQT
jgi:hypothetical protein